MYNSPRLPSPREQNRVLTWLLVYGFLLRSRSPLTSVLHHDDDALKLFSLC